MRGKKKKRIVETAGHERLLPACAECKSSRGNLWFLKFHASLFEQLCLYQEFGPMNFYISPISLFITESILKGFIHTVERKGQYEEDVSKYCPAHIQFGSSLGSWNLKTWNSQGCHWHFGWRGIPTHTYIQFIYLSLGMRQKTTP